MCHCHTPGDSAATPSAKQAGQGLIKIYHHEEWLLRNLLSLGGLNGMNQKIDQPLDFKLQTSVQGGLAAQVHVGNDCSSTVQ